MRREIARGAVVLLLLTSCGDDTTTDSDTERGQEYVDAAVSVVVGASGEDGTEDQRDDFRCMMARAVDAIGLDTLDEAQVTPEEFAEAENLPAVGLEISEDQARDAAEGQLACLDLVEIFVLDESTDEETECARNALDTHMEALRESLKDELLGDGETDLSSAVDELLIEKCDISIYID